MWKISIAILLGFIILAFNHVWINRHAVIKTEEEFIIFNKWIGKVCSYSIRWENRFFDDCDITLLEEGNRFKTKIKLP